MIDFFLRELLEAATYRYQADQVMAQAVLDCRQAVGILQASRYSPSAIGKFRARIMRTLSEAADQLFVLGQQAAGQSVPDAALRYVITEYLAGQAAYLDNWIADLNAPLSAGGSAYRAQLYAQSLEQVYQRAYFLARQRQTGLPDLPAYPRDGHTRCRTNCHCRWVIRHPQPWVYLAYWTLRHGEHCPDCQSFARRYNPLRLERIAGEWLVGVAGEASQAPGL